MMSQIPMSFPRLKLLFEQTFPGEIKVLRNESELLANVERRERLHRAHDPLRCRGIHFR